MAAEGVVGDDEGIADLMDSLKGAAHAVEEGLKKGAHAVEEGVEKLAHKVRRKRGGWDGVC